MIPEPLHYERHRRAENGRVYQRPHQTHLDFAEDWKVPDKNRSLIVILIDYED